VAKSKGKAKLVAKDHGLAALWKRAQDLARLKTARVRVGVLSDTEKGGMRVPGGALTLAELAAVLHFGTKDGRIPARPFLTITFEAKKEHLRKLGADLMAKVIFGEIPLETALNAMGAYMAAETKNTITAGVPPPNAPSTAIAKAMKGKTAKFFKQKKQRHIGDAIADAAATSYVEKLGGHGRGGRRAVGAARTLGDAFAQIGAIAAVKPLIDTGRLLGSITWSVDMTGGKSK
jgi:phage gpG-like protein